MDPKLREIYNFGLYFLDLSPQQRQSFSSQIQRSQCKHLQQTATNILLNSRVDLSNVDREYFRKKKQALRQLASKSVCLDDKRSLLPRYSGLVRRIMIVIVNYLAKIERRVATEGPTTTDGSDTHDSV